MSAHTHPTLLTPRVLIPFLIVTLIWGSTWLVIRDQISSVPPAWSVCYRFVVASIGMTLLALWRGDSMRVSWRIQGFAMLLGVLQFAMNFNFVYHAEGFITSGLVAVLFALLIVPNTLLSRLLHGTPVSPRFLAGGGIAVVGVVLLLMHEGRRMDVDTMDVLAGAGLTLAGVLSASVANVMQAGPTARGQSIFVLLAWAMIWGVVANALWALATVGPPTIDLRPGYLAGVAYLGLLGSVVCFPLYSGIIRAVGAGPAAWSSVLVPVIAMALSTIAEGYDWSLLAVGGAILSLVGLIVALRGPRPAVPAGPASGQAVTDAASIP